MVVNLPLGITLGQFSFGSYPNNLLHLNKNFTVLGIRTFKERYNMKYLIFIIILVFIIMIFNIKSIAFEFEWKSDDTPTGVETYTQVEPLQVNIFDNVKIQIYHI